jgi:hypothetical protein
MGFSNDHRVLGLAKQAVMIDELILRNGVMDFQDYENSLSSPRKRSD